MSQSLNEAITDMCDRAEAVRESFPAWIRWAIPKAPSADRMMRELTEHGWSHLPGYTEGGLVDGSCMEVSAERQEADQ